MPGSTSRGACTAFFREVRAVLSADGNLLPSSFAKHFRSGGGKPLTAASTLCLLLETLLWLAERVVLLALGAFHRATAPPSNLTRSARLPKALVSAGFLLVKVLAVFAGALLATYRLEYLQSAGLDAHLQFTYDGLRLAVSPPGGFAELPLPTPLPRALDEPPKRKLLHHVTVATRVEENLYRLLRTATWHGDSVEVVGRNDPRLQSWGGFGLKMQHMVEYVSDLPPDDVVLWTDAYDVLMLGSHADVLGGYASVLSAHPPSSDPAGAGRAADVVFTAEANCAPDAERAGAYPPADRTHLFPYLNSGLLIGTAGGVSRMLASMPGMREDENDQRWFTALYLESTRNASMPRIVLDHDARVFLSMTFREVGAELVYSPLTRTFSHAVTGTVPAIIHYPGWVWKKQHVQTWHLLQGANNAHCGLFMCMPLYAGACLLGATLTGMLLGQAWHRLLPSFKLGRAIASLFEGEE